MRDRVLVTSFAHGDSRLHSIQWFRFAQFAGPLKPGARLWRFSADLALAEAASTNRRYCNALGCRRFSKRLFQMIQSRFVGTFINPAVICHQLAGQIFVGGDVSFTIFSKVRGFQSRGRTPVHVLRLQRQERRPNAGLFGVPNQFPEPRSVRFVQSLG